MSIYRIHNKRSEKHEDNIFENVHFIGDVSSNDNVLQEANIEIPSTERPGLIYKFNIAIFDIHGARLKFENPSEYKGGSIGVKFCTDDYIILYKVSKDSKGKSFTPSTLAVFSNIEVMKAISAIVVKCRRNIISFLNHQYHNKTELEILMSKKYIELLNDQKEFDRCLSKASIVDNKTKIDKEMERLGVEGVRIRY